MGVGFVTRRAGTLVKDISSAEVTLDFSSVTYDGSEHAPKITRVELGGNELRDMQDYYAVITRQQNAGDYNIIVNGIGEYGGVKQVPWHITKAAGSIRLEPPQVTIQGAAGTTATVNIISTGDGEITVSQSRYVTSKVSGKQITLTSVQDGSDTLTVTLGEGRNYIGDTAELSVEVKLKKPVSDVFEENDWETIAEVCADGEAKDHWNVGNEKSFTRGGVTYHFQIGGFDHDDLDPTDSRYNDPTYNHGSKKAAMTLIMKEVFTDNPRMHTSNDNTVSWKGCEMRTTTIPQIKSEMDQDLIAVIRTVTKKTAQSGKDATIVSTPDDLFMLCELEVWDSSSYAKPGEGTQYEYFKAGNSRVKKQSGTAKWYWLRSPHSDYTTRFVIVSSNGNGSSSSASDTYGGVVLCVCI